MIAGEPESVVDDSCATELDAPEGSFAWPSEKAQLSQPKWGSE